MQNGFFVHENESCLTQNADTGVVVYLAPMKINITKIYNGFYIIIYFSIAYIKACVAVFGCETAICSIMQHDLHQDVC